MTSVLLKYTISVFTKFKSSGGEFLTKTGEKGRGSRNGVFFVAIS